MPKQARLNDLCTGICYGHIVPIPTVAYINSGSNTTKTDNLATARLTDIAKTGCGHIGIISSGSSTVKTDKKPNARVGDSVTGIFIGVISIGSPKRKVG